MRSRCGGGRYQWLSCGSMQPSCACHPGPPLHASWKGSNAVACASFYCLMGTLLLQPQPFQLRPASPVCRCTGLPNTAPHGSAGKKMISVVVMYIFLCCTPLVHVQPVLHASSCCTNDTAWYLKHSQLPAWHLSQACGDTCTSGRKRVPPADAMGCTRRQ